MGEEAGDEASEAHGRVSARNRRLAASWLVKTQLRLRQGRIFLGGLWTCSPREALLPPAPKPPPVTPPERGQDQGISQAKSDPAVPRPFTAAEEPLGSAGIFSSVRHITRVHGVTHFGEAKRSPRWVPARPRAGEDGGGPGKGSPGHCSPGTRCFVSLRLSTADPEADAGEEEEGPAGARAACSGATCRALGWALLCGTLTAFLLGLLLPLCSCLVQNQ